MKTIVYIHGDNLNVRPPVYSTLLRLNDLGFKLLLITKGVDTYWAEELLKRDIQYFIIKSNFVKHVRLNQILFRLFFQRNLKKIVNSIEQKDLLWIEGARTLISIRHSFLKKYRFAIQVMELYDTHKKLRNKLAWYFKNAKYSFVPEYTRANVFRMWYGLKKLPSVIVNSPYDLHLNNSDEYLKQRIPKLWELIQDNKKIILYQGSIGKERNIDNIARFIDTLADAYVLVIIGPPRGIDSCLSISKKVIYLGQFKAPEHLLVTERAYMGILGYLGIHLNNLFCAPNKLYEYSKFGVPMLGNDIPGLYNPFRIYKAGENADFDNIAEIKNAFFKIEQAYQSYQEGAKQLYQNESTAIPEVLKLTLKELL